MKRVQKSNYSPTKKSELFENKTKKYNVIQAKPKTEDELRLEQSRAGKKRKSIKVTRREKIREYQKANLHNLLMLKRSPLKFRNLPKTGQLR